MSKQVLQKLQLLSLSVDGVLMMQTIVLEKLRLENCKDFQARTGLSDVRYRRALNELLERSMLEWVPEKTHRKKALYFGKEALNLGITQIVKSYTASIQSDRDVEDCLNPRGPVCPPRWQDRGLGATKPRREDKTDEGMVRYHPYYETQDKGLKTRFMNVYRKGKKIATAHLYQKAMARVCSTNVPPT